MALQYEYKEHVTVTEPCASEPGLDRRTSPRVSPAIPRLPQDARLQALKQARQRARQDYFTSPTRSLTSEGAGEQEAKDPWRSRLQKQTANDSECQTSPATKLPQPDLVEGMPAQVPDVRPKETASPAALYRGATSHTVVTSPPSGQTSPGDSRYKSGELRNVTSECGTNIQFSVSEEICPSEVKVGVSAKVKDGLSEEDAHKEPSHKDVRACRAEVNLLLRNASEGRHVRMLNSDFLCAGTPVEAFSEFHSIGMRKGEISKKESGGLKERFRKLRRSLSNLRIKGKKYRQEND